MLLTRGTRDILPQLRSPIDESAPADFRASRSPFVPAAAEPVRMVDSFMGSPGRQGFPAGLRQTPARSTKSNSIPICSTSPMFLGRGLCVFFIVALQTCNVCETRCQKKVSTHGLTLEEKTVTCEKFVQPPLFTLTSPQQQRAAVLREPGPKRFNPHASIPGVRTRSGRPGLDDRVRQTAPSPPLRD